MMRPEKLMLISGGTLLGMSAVCGILYYNQLQNPAYKQKEFEITLLERVIDDLEKKEKNVFSELENCYKNTSSHDCKDILSQYELVNGMRSAVQDRHDKLYVENKRSSYRTVSEAFGIGGLFSLGFGVYEHLRRQRWQKKMEEEMKKAAEEKKKAKEAGKSA